MSIAFVQSKGQGFNNSTSARTLAFDSNVTVGNFLVVAVSTFSGAIPVLTVTDGLGNEYEQFTVYPPQQVGTARIHLFIVRIAIAGACTVSVDPNGTSVYMGLGIHEYSGVDAITPIESWSSRHQTSVTACTAGQVYTNNSGVAIFAAYTQPAGTIAGTAGTGFTKRVDQPNSSSAMTLFTQDKLGVSGDTDTPFTFASAVTQTGVSFGMLPTVTPTAGIQLVQKAGYAEYVSPTTSTYVSTALTVNYPFATTTGNLLVCCVGTVSGSAGTLTATVTDNKGNTWQLLTAESATSGSGLRVAIYQCVNTNGGSGHIVTVTPDANVYVSAVVLEYSGASNVLLTAANNSGVTSTPTSGSLTSIANGLVIAVMGEDISLGTGNDYQNTIGYKSGWSNKASLPGLSQQSMGISVITLGDITNAAGGTTSADWKFIDTAFWVVTAAVLQPNSVLAISGTGSAAFVGQTTFPAHLDISGTATVAFVGASGSGSTLAITGASTVAFVAASTAASVLAITGSSTVLFVGAATLQDEGVLHVIDLSTVAFVSTTTKESVLTITGTTVVDFVGEGPTPVVGGWRPYAFKGPIIIPPPVVLGGTPMRFLKRRFARGWRRKLGRFGM